LPLIRQLTHPKDWHMTMRISPTAGAVAAGAVLALTALSGCKTQAIQTREDNLAAAGFSAKPANTPELKAMLNKLPPNKFVIRQNGSVVNYVYADPLVCGCLYVGTQAQYAQYVRERQTQDQIDEQAMTAQAYQDASWNWNAWGPWGPQYGFVYGPGW
jgi:hypothetical protein